MRATVTADGTLRPHRVVVLEAEKRLDAQTGVAPEFGKRAPDPWAKQR